ncbi:biotin--protein ligase 1, chloroplastic isoform X2 [Ricinus communis]|uniref:biotin--protein ligase 1, chloroplastic isoform X2 n=1 Tax=Ricinus communis TaxID=3988 RepID=UPI00201A80F6|nr:biotin--protein ligase 1, chloroplastic isoform X2 [Ricinus communis]
MDNSSSSTCTLILSGYSAVENEIAQSLKQSSSIKHPDDDEITLLLESEISIPEKENSFDQQLFFNNLSTNRFGRLLIWSPRLTSTQDFVSHNFYELPIGTVCVADTQSKGRGWLEAWESPLGSLLFTFKVEMVDVGAANKLQFVISLAVTEAIKDVCQKNGLPVLDVKIKWPAYLYLNGQRVGGILCNSTYKSKKFNISAGIGLNVDNEKPTTCLNAVLRELSPAASQLRREEILAAFFNKFESLYDLLINQGLQSLEELFDRAWHSDDIAFFKDYLGEFSNNLSGTSGDSEELARGESFTEQMEELVSLFIGLKRSKFIGRTRAYIHGFIATIQVTDYLEPPSSIFN